MVLVKEQGFDTDKEQSTLSVNLLKEKRAAKIRNAAIVIIVAISLVLLYFLSRQNYLLFHSMTEVFSIVIAFAIFAIAWNNRRLIDNRYFIYIGIAFLFVAGINFFHTLAYKGMGVFPNFGANLATQLWIATRYMLSFSFLIPLLFIKRKIKPGIIAVGYGIVMVLLLASIFVWQNFPQAYVEGVGLTAFKVGSEYAISLILVFAIGLLIKKRAEFSDKIFKLLLSAMAVAVATELAFTLYNDVYGIANMVGHMLNVVSFYLIYRALVEQASLTPMNYCSAT